MTLLIVYNYPPNTIRNERGIIVELYRFKNAIY